MTRFSAVATIFSVSLALAAPPPATAPAARAASPKVVPSVGAPSVGALGGSFASPGMSRPLGGVALPTFPAGVPAKRGNRPSSGGGYRYVGPVYYTPGVYDSGYYDSPSTFNTPASPPVQYGQQPAAQQQPIIINQYFSTREGAPVAATEETANPGDPLGDPQKYYLIAYKDRSIYSALAYWLEGHILHYVTTQNTHNQASLDLIDLEQTTRLNADKNVPFTLTAPLTGK